MVAERTRRSRRIGLAGAGAISEVHLRALSGMGSLRVVGLADPDLEAAKRRANRHEIPAVFPDLEQLLEALEPEAVHVLTPPSTHAALAIEALRSGAHVYVEKPMAYTEEECRRMEAAAAKADRLLCVGHSMVRDPLFRRLGALLKAGELGEVVLAFFHFAFDPSRHPGFGAGSHWSRSLPGGPLEDLAAHPASVLAALLGDVRRVRRVPAADPELDAERPTLAAAVHGERGLGLLSLSVRVEPADIILDVRCTRGGARLNYSNRTLSVERARDLSPKVERGLRNLQLAAQVAGQTLGSAARHLVGRLDATGGVRTLVREFHQAIADGAPAPVSPAEGRRAVRLLRSIWPLPVPL